MGWKSILGGTAVPEDLYGGRSLAILNKKPGIPQIHTKDMILRF
jgi:hypothetical protein